MTAAPTAQIFTLTVEQLSEVVRKCVREELDLKQGAYEKPILNHREVCLLLDLSRKTVDKHIKENGLPYVAEGKFKKFDRASVLAWNATRIRGKKL